jgi:DNA polymerase-1
LKPNPEDADISYQLKKLLEPEIENPHLHHLFYDVEMPLVKVLREIEQERIAIDTAALTGFSKELDERWIELDEQIKEFNKRMYAITSTPLIVVFICNILGIFWHDKIHIQTHS